VVVDDGTVLASTLAKPYRLLRVVVNTALDDELIGRNPCQVKDAGSSLDLGR
jgi:hypothetical protein